ncbi:MAG TPA: LamG-like jellyroll fold domain-containing protein [Candidatus Limnocylindrales bacterium]|nr:LamG-like jellyroll fold domain-containing protein [Candidatus Limnocylindrales bacterium]
MNRRVLRLWLLALLLAPSTSTAATEGLIGDYQFNQTLAPVVGSLPAMTEIGPADGMFIVDEIHGITRTAFEFPQHNGLQITPTTGLDGTEPYTIILEVRLADLSGYRRLVDFKNGQSDTGLYLLGGALIFYNKSASGGRVCPDTWVQMAITRDANKNVIGYIDGNAYFGFTDTTDLAMISDSTLRFFRDNECAAGACSEASAGAVARVLIYDTAFLQSTLRQIAGVLCGDANRDGSIKASDALLTLKTAVGAACCQVESCDVGAPGGISASDSLAILKASVGQEVELVCPSQAIAP